MKKNSNKKKYFINIKINRPIICFEKNQDCNLIPKIAEYGLKLIFVTFYVTFHEETESQLELSHNIKLIFL